MAIPAKCQRLPQIRMVFDACSVNISSVCQVSIAERSTDVLQVVARGNYIIVLCSSVICGHEGKSSLANCPLICAEWLDEPIYFKHSQGG